MTSIPIVWKKDDQSPPEWVLFEMQGELQYKGSGNTLDKKGAATTSSNAAVFGGLEMGILSPHAEHGPTKPELRIGNLVVPGKLMKLPKPLLVLVTRKLDSADDSSASDHTKSPPTSGQKRSRDDEKDSAENESASKKSKPSDSANDEQGRPRSCLQTIAVIRQKYVFNARPYSICETATPAATH